MYTFELEFRHSPVTLVTYLLVHSSGVYKELSLFARKVCTARANIRSKEDFRLIRRLGTSTDSASDSQSSIHCSRLASLPAISDSFLPAVISHSHTCCIIPAL